MPIKLKKNTIDYVNAFYPGASTSQKDKLYRKFYEQAVQKKQNEDNFNSVLTRDRNSRIEENRRSIIDELEEERQKEEINNQAAAAFGAKPIDYYQMRLKALGMDEAGRTIKLKDGKAVGVPEIPKTPEEEEAADLSEKEKRALEIRKKYSEYGTGDIGKESEKLQKEKGTWGRRLVNYYNYLMRGVDIAIDGMPFLDADNSEELKAVNAEARKRFPGGSINPIVDIADWASRSAYRFNQYYANKYPVYNHKVDEFDVSKPNIGTAFYNSTSSLVQLVPQLVGGMEAKLLEKIGLKFFGKAYGKTLATKLAENAAKKGSSKFVQKTIQKSTELLAATPKNAGALYRYTFDLNVDDLVNNQGYSIDDPNTYKRASKKALVESSLEGVFDQFSYLKEGDELIQGLFKGKKGVYKELGKNVGKGMVSSGAEEATQSAATMKFEIEDAKAKINDINNKIATGEIDPEQGAAQIQELEYNASKIAKQIAGDFIIGSITPVVMKVPQAVGYSIGPVEQKALGLAVSNPEEFNEALNGQVARKQMTAEEAERMRSFYDQVKTQYDRALTMNAPVSYQKKTGLKKMNSSDALKLAVEAARFNSLATEFTLATDDKQRKEIKDAAALSMQAMSNIRSGADISKRRVSGEEIANIVSGQTPKGNFNQGQAERIISKPGFQQETVDTKEELEQIVMNDAETMGYVMDIRAGKLKVNSKDGGNVVVDAENGVIDGKKRIAQRYVDAFYGNQDEVERNRQQALNSSNLAYNIYKRKQEQNNFIDDVERERATKFLENPVQELAARLAAVEDRLAERRAQRFQGMTQEGGMTEAQLEKDAQELRNEISKHNEIEEGANSARIQGEFVPFVVTKAVSGEATMNTAVEATNESNPNETTNSFYDMDAAIASEVDNVKTEYWSQKYIDNQDTEIDEVSKETRDRALLEKTVNQLALAGIKYDDLIQALADVTGISPLIAEGVIKHMASENMLPTSEEIMKSLNEKATLAVENNKSSGQTLADVNMTPEDNAKIEEIENSATQTMMQIPVMARLLTWANNAIVNSKSREEKADASVLLNDPVAFLKAEIAKIEQQINEVQAPTPQESEQIVAQLNGQLKELTDALAQVEQITAISEAKKDEVVDGVQARVEAEEAVGEPVAGEQVKPTRVQEIKYQIEQLEAAREARIKDLLMKGATLKEATNIANFEMSEDDKKALSLLKDELNEIAKSGVVEKPKNEREKRAEEREVNKELTKNLTNIFNQMGVESPKRKKKNCP